MIQFLIALTGILSIMAISSPHPTVRRAGCVFGLAGQPFWVYTAVVNAQWGIALLAIVYTAVFVYRLQQKEQ